jgi:acetyl esterase/lipase
VAGADLNTPSYIENQNAIPLGKADIEWFVDQYLNSTDEAKDARVDLVNAELADLPPTTIIGAEIDPLASEGKTLADKLEAAGVEVTYQLWEGVTHEFFGMAAVVSEAKEAQNLAGESLREAFGSEQVVPK